MFMVRSTGLVRQFSFCPPFNFAFRGMFVYSDVALTRERFCSVIKRGDGLNLCIHKEKQKPVSIARMPPSLEDVTNLYG